MSSSRSKIFKFKRLLMRGFFLLIFLLLIANAFVFLFSSGDKCFVPERRRKFVYMINALNEVFTEEGLTYWIDGGTLLGAYRYQDVIPWDHDADVSYLSNETSKHLVDGGKLQEIFLEKYGIMINPARLRMEKEGDLTDEQPYIDLMSWHCKKNTSCEIMTPYYGKRRLRNVPDSVKSYYHDFPTKWISPMGTITLAGNPDIKCPNEVVKYLKKRYPHSFYMTVSYSPNCYLPWNLIRWVFK